MYLIYVNCDFKYHTEAVLKLFFPMEKFEFVFTDVENYYEIIHNIKEDLCFFMDNSDGLFVGVKIGKDKKSTNFSAKTDDKTFEISKMLYMLLIIITRKRQPWGILTGIRPLMLIQNNFLVLPEKPPENDFLKKYYSVVEPVEGDLNKIIAAASAVELRKKYLVSYNKAKLAALTALNQKDIISNSKGISLYISIPFCPSRCDYCSFVSHSIEKAFKLIPQYIDLLCKELDFMSENCSEKIDTVYIGGGTPTVLSAEDLDKILRCVAKFNLSNCTEITVEAGRPETISKEKLDILASHNVGRISINPQTFNQEILDNLGRKHTISEIYCAFELVKKYPFDVNMDIIAGLPGDTLHGFRNSLNRCIRLSPENITVHTLSLKKGAKLYNSKEIQNIKFQTVIANKKLLKNDYEPYYIYRQKNTLGNLENTGYSKSGKYCRYNVYTMADCQTIIAFGAGGMSKLVYTDRLERIANFKYPYEYIGNFETILQRKKMAVDAIKSGEINNI